MRPAYHIALTATEKRIITDLAAIQSQIEWLMWLTVKNLLELTPEASRKIMASTSFNANAEIWIGIVRDKHPHKSCIEWAEYAFVEMGKHARNRNDFLHTLYGFGDGLSGPDEMALGWGHVGWGTDRNTPRMAVRLKSVQLAPLAELAKIRHGAAHLSVVVAHIEWMSDPANDGSPWLRRLGRQLPPPKPAPEPRKATKRQRQPES